MSHEAVDVNCKNGMDKFSLDNPSEKATNVFQCSKNQFTREAFKRAKREVIGELKHT